MKNKLACFVIFEIKWMFDKRRRRLFAENAFADKIILASILLTEIGAMKRMTSKTGLNRLSRNLK